MHLRVSNPQLNIEYIVRILYMIRFFGKQNLFLYCKRYESYELQLC